MEPRDQKKRRKQKGEDAERVGSGRIGAQQGRGNQQGNAPKTDQQAKDPEGIRAYTARAKGFDGGHPERHGADDQRGNAGGDVLFGQRNETIAAEQEQQADHGGAQPLAAGGRRVAGRTSPDVQDQARQPGNASRP